MGKAKETKKTEAVREKVKNGITELVFILDRSGSMGGLVSDTIGGFNAMIEKQRKEEGECLVSTVLFNHESAVIHDRIPLSEVPLLTEKEYVPSGCTALIDAIGDAVRHITTVHRYIRPEDVPEHTMFVITTDGLENASHKYTGAEVRQMVERAKEEHGYEFIFIGANIDSVETARRYGIDAERAVNYHADKRGTNVLFKTVAAAVGSVRRDERLDGDWAAELKEDYESRKK